MSALEPEPRKGAASNDVSFSPPGYTPTVCYNSLSCLLYQNRFGLLIRTSPSQFFGSLK